MLRTITAFVLLLTCSTSAAEYGRWCSSSNCAMCNALERQYRFEHPPIPVVPDVGTPTAVIPGILQVMELSSSDVLLDIGCGDGRFLITAVKTYGCIGVGVEIDPATAAKAAAAVKAAGLQDRISITVGDARQFRCSAATAVVVYQDPTLLVETQPMWQNARVVASYMHRLPGVTNKAWRIRIDQQVHPFFVYWNIPPGWTSPVTKPKSSTCINCPGGTCR